MIDYIKMIEQEQLRTDLPNIAIGDYVRVHLKVREGTRERIQVFEGTIIARKSGGARETITVRRLSYGVGVERVLPLHSPRISRIEIVRRGKIRRAKLYYLRDRVGKAARVKERLELRDYKKTGTVAAEAANAPVPAAGDTAAAVVSNAGDASDEAAIPDEAAIDTGNEAAIDTGDAALESADAVLPDTADNNAGADSGADEAQD